MVVYQYHWKIKAGKEKQFETNWRIVTQYIYANCGSLGSRLHIGRDGDYMAYAQWPSSDLRESCSLNGEEVRTASGLMSDAILESFATQVWSVKDDLLADEPV